MDDVPYVELNDPNFVIFDFVINFVGISKDLQFANARLVGLRSYKREIAEAGDPLFNQLFDRLSRDRGSFVQIREDFFEVALCPDSVADLHAP
jgi:hypothetical protein